MQTSLAKTSDPPTAGDVYIGRASKWGNPFPISRRQSREEVIRRFEDYIRQNPALMATLPELRGKRLVCHCAPKPCHGDVLMRLIHESNL